MMIFLKILIKRSRNCVKVYIDYEIGYFFKSEFNSPHSLSLYYWVRCRYSSARWPRDACTMTSHHSRDKQATVAPNGHCRHDDWAHPNNCGKWCASRPMLSLIRWRVICGGGRESGMAEEAWTSLNKPWYKKLFGFGRSKCEFVNYKKVDPCR